MSVEIAVDFEKRYAAGPVIRISLNILFRQQSVLVLFGPSGAGKSVTLRCLAGLERPDYGKIQVAGEIWFDGSREINLSPQNRHIGYLFQDNALFPHLTAVNNIRYGLEALSRKERRARITELMRLMRLEGMENRHPHELSSGEKQRLALARALARHPRLLLLDEPFSALDLPTRKELQMELRQLIRNLEIPTIYVTHDWAEALVLGDQMAILSRGEIVQVGTPQDIFNQPQTSDVARIVGIETIIPGKVIESSEGLVTVESGGVNLLATGAERVGSEVFVCIQAEEVTLERDRTGLSSARNRLMGTVREVRSTGTMVCVKVDCGFLLSAMVTHAALEELQLAPGISVVAMIKAGAVHLAPR